MRPTIIQRFGSSAEPIAEGGEDGVFLCLAKFAGVEEDAVANGA